MKCSQRLDRRASRCAWWHVGRRAAAARDRSIGCAAAAAPGKLAHRPRHCAARGEGAARAPVVPPRSPHGAPVELRGGLVGGSSSGGPGNWLTASAAKKTTHPQPLPVREGAMPTPRPPVGGSKGVRARGSVFREPGPGPGWLLSIGDRHGKRFCHPAVGADPNLSHRADRILSQGWKPTLSWSAVDKFSS